MTYETTDIVLAAFLRLQGAELANIKKEGARGTFIFKQHENLDDWCQAFDLGLSKVEPIAFNNMIKQLTTSVRRI